MYLKIENSPSTINGYRLGGFIVGVLASFYVHQFFSSWALMLIALLGFAYIALHSVVPYLNITGTVDLASAAFEICLHDGTTYPLKNSTQVAFNYIGKRAWFGSHYHFGNQNELLVTNHSGEQAFWICVENAKEENALRDWLQALHKSEEINLKETRNGSMSRGLSYVAQPILKSHSIEAEK